MLRSTAKMGRKSAAFLERYAGDAGKLGSAGEPPRITQTARFIRKHREISGENSGKTRASNRRPIAKPAIAARPTAITANTTSAFLN
jgi:hypothetical protein